MTTERRTQADSGRSTVWQRDIGPHGWTMVTWAMAGGVALGGVLVALMTLAGQLSGYGLFMTSTGLFVIGAAIGLAHGGILGWLGRPDEVTGREAGADLLLAFLYCAPALAVAWLATVWIAMTMPAAFMASRGPLVVAAVGWGMGGAILSASAITGLRALKRAYSRWPERAAGTVVVAATFGALLMTFLANRPEVWGLRVRVTEIGGVLLAGIISIWLVGPFVTLALRLLRQLPTQLRPQLGLSRGWGAAADVTIGLGVGLVIGLLAVPFSAYGVTPARAGALVVEISHALVDEVLLRLVLTTGMAWLLLRWHDLHREEVAVLTVATVALVQMVLYTPGILAIGFPTTIAAGAFAVTAVLLPAVAFGALYWVRGFSTALLADAVFVLILAT